MVVSEGKTAKWVRKGPMSTLDISITIRMREELDVPPMTFNHLWNWDRQNGQDFIVEFKTDQLFQALGIP